MLSRIRRAARELLGPSHASSRPVASAERPVPPPPQLEEHFDSSCPQGPILRLDRCPVCGEADATPVVDSPSIAGDFPGDRTGNTAADWAAMANDDADTAATPRAKTGLFGRLFGKGHLRGKSIANLTTASAAMRTSQRTPWSHGASACEKSVTL